MHETIVVAFSATSIVIANDVYGFKDLKDALRKEMNENKVELRKKQELTCLKSKMHSKFKHV